VKVHKDLGQPTVVAGMGNSHCQGLTQLPKLLQHRYHQHWNRIDAVVEVVVAAAVVAVVVAVAVVAVVVAVAVVAVVVAAAAAAVVAAAAAAVVAAAAAVDQEWEFLQKRRDANSEELPQPDPKLLV
jgi:hypothetical protein